MAVLSTKTTTAWAEVDEHGRLIIPPEVAQQYGLNPGSRSASTKAQILSACIAR